MSMLIGYNNQIEAATLTSTLSFAAGHSLDNVKDRILGHYAKSVALTPFSSFSITIDLGAQFSDWKVLGLIGTNIFPNIQYQITQADDVSFATGVSVSPIFTTPYNINPDSYAQNIFFVVPSSYGSRVIKIDFYNFFNFDNTIKIGRIFVGDAIDFKQGLSKGTELGYQVETVIQESMGGVEYFDEKTPRRRFNFSIDYLTNAEAYTKGMGLEKSVGVSKEVLLIADTNDALYGNQRNFLGRLSQLSPLKTPYINYNQKAFEILEIV